MKLPTLPHKLRSNLSISLATVGAYSITHRQQKRFDVVSMREAFMTGKRASFIELAKPHTIHELRDGDGVWMTDIPIEVRQMREAVEKLQPFGRVLVGGLGLGIVATMLTSDPSVTHVDVVELSPEVAQLVGKGAPYNVIVADVYDFLRNLKRWDYDCAFFDTWRGTGEGEWWESVFPLRRIIANRFGRQNVECWAEDIMLGQVFRALQEGPTRWYYREALGMPMPEKAARKFLTTIGLPAWEKKWGAAYPKDERL